MTSRSAKALIENGANRVELIFDFMIGAGVLISGDLQVDDAPPFIAYIAGACYLAGEVLKG